MKKQRISRLVAACLAVLLVVSTLPVSAFAADIAAQTNEGLLALRGEGTEENPYLLETGDDLKVLSDEVNGGESYKGQYFRFAADITLPADWTPLGSGGKSFSGVIDGNGKMLTVPSGSLSLIGKPVGATVKNLNLYGEKIPGYGLVQGYTTGSDITIDRVTIKAGSHILYAGLIGGYGNSSVTITHCTVEKGVIIGDDGSGFWGNHGDTSYSYPFVGKFDHRDNIGSFAGAFNGTISDCVSYATVYGGNNVGGIVGMKGQSMREFYVNSCAFYGDVIATGKAVGGIVGSGYPSASSSPCVTVENCYAVGRVQGASCVGGIFGGEMGTSNCLNNGVGSVRNNFFAGTVAATDADSQAGGVIGYMKSLNRYNVIDGNYYTADCGAQRGIGEIQTVKTAADDPHYGREDEPTGADANAVALQIPTADLTNGNLVSRLNASLTGHSEYKQGAQHPVFGDEKHVISVTSQNKLASSPEKSVYAYTDYSLLENYDITVKYSDGTVRTVKASEGTFSGVDFTKTGYQIATLLYEGYAMHFGVKVNELPASSNAVSVTVLGDTDHGDNGEVHLLKNGDLSTWVAKKAYLLDKGLTVKDLLEKCFAEKNIAFVNETGNYISQITFDGVTLGEMTNGANAGWLYAVNGAISDLGIAEYVPQNGDEVVLFYSDDYTQENWQYNADVLQVTKLLEDLPEADGLTLAYAAQVFAARDAYAGLDEDEQAFISDALKEKLEADVLKIAELQKAQQQALSDIYQKTGNALLQDAKANGLTVSSVSGEWAMIGLARAGALTDDVADAYYQEVVTVLRENGSAKLHTVKSTENARVILALTAIGKDVTNAAGYDLLEPLSDWEYVQFQGVNGPIWTLIALDAHDYAIPKAEAGKTQTTREGLIAYILEKQSANGGWGLHADDDADADLTAMAIQALAPYYAENAEVRRAVDKALDYLSAVQNADGSFSSWGTSNFESVAQTIIALATLGIDPTADARFIKNGYTLMDALLAFSTGDGFKHAWDDEQKNDMTTEQGYLALVSYNRLLNDKTSLYDMRDVQITPSKTPSHGTPAGDNGTSAPNTSPQEGNGTSAPNVAPQEGNGVPDQNAVDIPDTFGERFGTPDQTLCLCLAAGSLLCLARRIRTKKEEA